MELYSPELKYFFISNSNLDFGIRTVKTPICILTKLRTGLSRSDGSIPDSGNIYFSYLKFPD